MPDDTDLLLRRILTDVLGLKQGQADTFQADTGLFGHLPELDSMAVAGLLTELEDRLDIIIEDDDDQRLHDPCFADCGPGAYRWDRCCEDACVGAPWYRGCATVQHTRSSLHHL